ncbi:DMT family transporter [Tianweitania sp. BSSL-BM11]|uniref:DMT family transporter n=1 Tax=Tianweitania aestuarii TaxID=2814886 RepID=A0ABS5S0G5_9HYPH|nr:DMT family transporter [Tianweitania aestuarii]MBS9722555.1 DMT family transporter [Tianweitania aestuarii]
MRRTAYILLALATLFWAGNSIAGKLAIGHVSPMILVPARWGAILVILLASSHRQLRQDWQAIKTRSIYLLALGALGFTVFSVALYYALLYTTAINTSILQGGMPLFVFAASFVLFGSRVQLEQVLGFTLSFIGVLVIALRGDWSNLVTLNINFGDALMLIAIVAYGFYTAALKAKPILHWTSLMTMLCLGATLAALPFLAIEAVSGSTILPDLEGWALIAFIVLFPSLLGQVLYIKGVELIGSNRAGLFINLLPLWGALLAVVVLGEAFHVYHAIALTMILAGIGLAERRSFARP